MKDKNYSSIQRLTKQLLAWTLSVQMAGVAYLIPALSFFSSITILNVSYAGTGDNFPAPLLLKVRKTKKIHHRLI